MVVGVQSGGGMVGGVIRLSFKFSKMVGWVGGGRVGGGGVGVCRGGSGRVGGGGVGGGGGG